MEKKPTDSLNKLIALEVFYGLMLLLGIVGFVYYVILLPFDAREAFEWTAFIIVFGFLSYRTYRQIQKKRKS